MSISFICLHHTSGRVRIDLIRFKNACTCVSAISDCALYLSHVSRHYRIHTSPQATYDQCYSTWADAHNVITEQTLTDSSDAYVQRPRSLAQDGYACKDTKRFCFLTNSARMNNFAIDFERVIRVKQIKIFVCRDNWFRNVEIRFGNSTDYATNPVICSSPIDTGGKDFVIKTLQPNSEERKGWQGQYMVLTEMSSLNYLSFYEIQVIELVSG